MLSRYSLTAILLLTTAGVSAQGKADLPAGTPLEVRVVSTLNKKGKKEKFMAFTGRAVTDNNGAVLIKEDTPVRISVRKLRRDGDSRTMEINFVSVNPVCGETVKLTGKLFRPSRTVDRLSRRDIALLNVALIPFGYLPTQTLPKKVRWAEVTVTDDVFVAGNYVIECGF